MFDASPGKITHLPASTTNAEFHGARLFRLDESDDGRASSKSIQPRTWVTVTGDSWAEGEAATG
jgi:hypothetical protein